MQKRIQFNVFSKQQGVYFNHILPAISYKSPVENSTLVQLVYQNSTEINGKELSQTSKNVHLIRLTGNRQKRIENCYRIQETTRRSGRAANNKRRYTLCKGWHITVLLLGFPKGLTRFDCPRAFANSYHP